MRKRGPETEIEDNVVHQLNVLFQIDDQLSWTADSLPTGAGNAYRQPWRDALIWALQDRDNDYKYLDLLRISG